MAIVKRSVKGSALTHAELDGNFTHLAGDGTYQFPATKGSSKQVLRMNSGATALEYATVDTDEVNEGSTNQYFTNARADARITAAGSANWNTAFGWGDHSTAGYQTTAGLNGAIDSHLNQSNPTSGHVLSWNGSDYAWISNAGYTTFTSDFDTRLAAKDTGDLSEGSNLYYTDARADARITAALIDEDNMASNSATRLPSQQSVKAYVDTQVANTIDAAPGALNTLNELAAALGDDANFSTTITNSVATKWTQDNTKISNWDTAHGWGDHSSAGYLTSETFTSLVQDTTPELGGDLVTAGNRITHASSGTVSMMDFTKTLFSETNHTVLSSVKSINLFLDSNGGDTGQAFRIYNNTNPDGTVTENTHIFKVAETGDVTISGTLNTHTIPGGTGTLALTSDLYTNSDVDAHLNQSNPTSGHVLSWNGSDYAWIANGSGSAVEKSFSVQTADFNAVSGERYGIDTSSNTVTATLPGSPSTGDAIFFADAGGNYATNKFTLGRNGNTIMGSATDMDVTTNNQSVGVFYNGTTWRIY